MKIHNVSATKLCIFTINSNIWKMIMEKCFCISIYILVCLTSKMTCCFVSYYNGCFPSLRQITSSFPLSSPRHRQSHVQCGIMGKFNKLSGKRKPRDVTDGQHGDVLPKQFKLQGKLPKILFQRCAINVGKI